MITAQKIGEMGSGADGTEDDQDSLAGMKRLKMPSSIASRGGSSVGSRSKFSK